MRCILEMNHGHTLHLHVYPGILGGVVLLEA